MFASVREATFVHRLNSRKSFAAAFGQRSLSGKLSAQPPERRSNADAVSNAKLGTRPRARCTARPDPDHAAEEVEIRCDAGSLMVCSGMSKDFTLEANVRFKPQFLRTTLYELVPGPLSFFVVLLVEISRSVTPSKRRGAPPARGKSCPSSSSQVHPVASSESFPISFPSSTLR